MKKWTGILGAAAFVFVLSAFSFGGIKNKMFVMKGHNN